MDSILTTIKKMFGLGEEDTSFDNDLIIDINSVLMVANQLGIGAASFLITDKTVKWSDLLGDRKDLDGVKTYIYLKVKLMFDPPNNSFLLDSIKNQIQELEWRLVSQVESTIAPIDTTPTE